MNYATLYSLLYRVRNLARFAVKLAIVVFGTQVALTFAAALADNSALASLSAYGLPALRLALAVIALRVMTRAFDAALNRVAVANHRGR